MSSEEKPKPPRKPRAPKKTVAKVVSDEISSASGNPGTPRDDEGNPAGSLPDTEVVSSAPAPKHDTGLPHPEIAGIDGLRKLAGLDDRSFPPPLTDRTETDTGTEGKDSGAEILPQTTADEPDSFPPQTTNESTKTDSAVGNDTNSTTQATADGTEKNTGNVPSVAVGPGLTGNSELLESLKLSRVRIPGETKSACKERLRMLARNAGLPRGTGPGTAYEWAMNAVIELFAPPPPAPVIESEMESPIGENTEASASPIGEKLPVDPIPVAPIAPSVPPVVEPDVPGLGTIPESWPELPANAPLQVEIAWVSANRLVVRSGKGVDLSRALSPAPSYSALSWLETSILFPSKFADISVKATADQDTEKEVIKRERMAIEEIRSLLAEMLEAKKT